MINNIPMELRQLPQWVCAGPDKIPINPRTKHRAEVDDPSTWATFDEAAAAGFNHVGFVLCSNDPYTIIDLDAPLDEAQWARHEKILQAFDSYTERSQSGNGYHIIVRGQALNRKRDKVEVYSYSRYMICTGNVVRQSPIRDYQQLLDRMVEEMTPIHEVDLVDEEGIMEDREVVEMAMRAINADKFNQLCNGDIREYPSQSEADFALLSIIAYYTRDNEQVRRLFRYSALGKREKALKNDTYLNFALRKIRAQQPPPVDMGALLQRAQDVAAPPPQEKPAPLPNIPPSDGRIYAQTPEFPIFPPGLLGELADYIYRSSVRPVPEVALAGALTLFAGIAGRQYNLPSTGLNLYTILLAKTGTGKEGAASGINRLLSHVRPLVPMIDEFRGPATFASGPALAKSLVEKPCQFSVLGEFGIFLKEMCGSRAFGPTVMLKRAFLDVYHKSGWNQVLLGTEYSDQQKNTGMVAAPCLTLLGESTQETFLGGLDTSMIRDGLIPRFLFIEYTGERPYLNPHAAYPPPPELTQRFADFAAGILQMSSNNTCIMVDYTPEAVAIADAFEKRTTDMINADQSLGHAEIWNRAHLKAIKLAALVSVGCNNHRPVIDEYAIRWAIQLVEKDTRVLLSRFESGDVGEGDAKLMADLRKIITAYFSKKPAASYGVTDKMYSAKLIPMSYLHKRAGPLASFANSRLGASGSLGVTIKAMIESGELIEISKITLLEKFQTTQRAFGIGDSWVRVTQ